MKIKCEGVREYAEGYDVTIEEYEGRTIVRALNECGCNSTMIDLADLVTWLYCHPEILNNLI